MSSKVQAWRTPVIEPSGAYSNSLVAVIQTCGCACAVLAPSPVPPASSSRPSSARIKIFTSGSLFISSGLGRFQQPAPAQERLGLRLAAAEGDIGVFRIDRSAGGIDVVMQPFGGRRVKNIAGFLEGAERVGVHHLRPHVAVIARRIMITGEDVAELGRPMPQYDLLGHADLCKLRLLERSDIPGH